MRVHRDLDRLSVIEPTERDVQLKLQARDWGESLDGDKWTLRDDPVRHFTRVIPVHQSGKSSSDLHESIVPFPSAPIYGINRKAEYEKPLARPNMDTIRVLRRPENKVIRRMFILHNGLNEAKDLKLYYRLADWILAEQASVPNAGDAACVIVPFPGHLMHSPFPEPFSETPLSRYLDDAGDLFRQFLKYMVGMRWLLSLVTDSDAEDWMVGGDLLNPETINDDLLEESKALYEASSERLKKADEMRSQQTDAGPVGNLRIGTATTLAQVKRTKELLRSVLNRDEEPDPLRVHVVGYSLGGFLAQSVFFAWPQVVSSCTTICSGGALSALSPTAFADPEEWQSVLHALRPELSNSMIQGRLGDDRQATRGKDDESKPVPVSDVAGMPLQRFGYFQRIFEQVFLQEDRGSYKERLSEYGLRMLFVSGGADPIVPPANILDASPEEGTTMLSIAGMTHFLNQDLKTGKRREKEEKDQRDFWLPQAGELIARVAIRSEHVHMDERQTAEELIQNPGSPELSLQVGSSLSSSSTFEAALDWVLKAVNHRHGWLFVCRNALPPAFIDRRHFTQWGSALHHHDVRVQQYAAGLRRRASSLEDVEDRTTLLIPESLQRWFIYLTSQFDAHSDAPSGRMTTEDERRKIWEEFEGQWWPSTRQFKAGNIGRGCDRRLSGSNLAPQLAALAEVPKEHVEVTQLPDVWIGIKGGEAISVGSDDREGIHRNFLDGVQRILDGTVSIQDHLDEGNIRIVQVSGAEFNPRYRGRVEKSAKSATRLLARCAAGLVRSSPMPEPSPRVP